MALLADFGIDANEIDIPSTELEDGVYEFEVGSVYVKEGSKAHPDRSWIIIEYIIGDTGLRKSELFELPQDPENMTDKETQRLGYYVSRLVDLGIPREEVNNVGDEDLVGLRGTLQLYSQAGKGANAGKMYQNIKNVKVGKTPSAAAQPKSKEARQTAASNPFA
jgi:hypothetical protein